MINKESFWIFSHLGLGDAICCNALYRHYANLHQEKVVIIPLWIHNLASVQWMLSDVGNIFFYPVETENEFLNCRNAILIDDQLRLGFYDDHYAHSFNPVKWDSEFYRQAGLDPEMKWSGFKLPEFQKDIQVPEPFVFCHEDKERGFMIMRDRPANGWYSDSGNAIKLSVMSIYMASEIHCIDSSMLNLADLMETPYCKKFVFHRYARRGLPPSLKKNWEIIS